MYAKFTGDSGAGGVATLTGSRVYHEIVPQGTAFPYLFFNKVIGAPWYVFGNSAAHSNYLYGVQAFAKDTSTASGSEVAQTIIDRVEVLFRNAALTGLTVINSRKDSDQPDITEIDPTDNERIFRRGCYLRIELA